MVDDKRKKARHKLADLIKEGVPAAQAVYRNLVGDFKGQSPVIVVASGGTFRPRFTMKGTKPSHRLIVYRFVRYADEDGTWTDEESEDLLDDTEEGVAQVIKDNPKTEFWEAITQETMSQTDAVVVGGIEYRREMTPYLID